MSDGPLPLVSVVLPTRGRPELVRLALGGVVDQRYDGPIECFVVHDQEPPDPSLEELSRPGRSITVLSNTRTQGLAGSRNTGLEHVSADFVASCDDDDIWHPDKLTEQMRRLEEDPSLVVVGAGIRLMMPEDRVVEWPARSPTVSQQELLRSRYKELHSSTLLIRRKVFAAAGGYDEKLPESYAEDYEWLLRAVQTGKIGTVERPLADIRKAGQSWFRERAEVVAAALEYMVAQHPEFRQSRRGHARVLGQIAYARATSGDKASARRYARQALRRWPAAPHAWLAIAHLTTGVDPATALNVARKLGRGIT